MNSSFDDSLDRLPAELAEDEYWAKVRNDHLTQLKKDAEGLPMTSAQNMLMERIATLYALMRKRETSLDDRVTPSEMQKSYDLWAKLTAEFNKQITIGEDKRRETMIKNIISIVENAVNMIEDDRTREDTRKRLAAGFLEAGY